MQNSLSRGSFLTTGGAAAAGALGLFGSAPAVAAPLHPEAGRGLASLLEGNERFVADKAVCPPLTARRLELAQGQSPFAIIISCSDSRVPVETIFDQTPGNIFGVRIAGNFVDDNGLGSIEYSVAALKSSLILVLGHTHCGAVKATVQYVQDGAAQPSHIQNLVQALEPAAKAARGKPGDWVENATIANVKQTVAALPQRSVILARAIAAQHLSVAGAVYHLDSGRVTVVT